ncbi:hypothetical protein SPJ221_132 [Staphylococcus phage vB_SauH_SPJ2]|nr:hypothetical protein LSA2308_00073 [Staphylococcus phage LSA2308]USZ62937.1 hypothetical protein LSA2311_orf00130 [Staphylococcus phage LSA2311]WEW53681.1 hypothetical protein SPJ221_132 [Staphylococcus phage vB_SauH_SPJ2]
MEKNISTHTKGISQKDMDMWLEAITQGTVEGKELTEDTAKQLHRIGARSVSLDEATRIARAINAVTVQEYASAFNDAFNAIDLLMIVMEDNLDVTTEQVEKAQLKLKEKREKYLEEKQEEVRKKQEEVRKKQEEHKAKEDNEKVVQLKKHDK